MDAAVAGVDGHLVGMVERTDLGGTRVAPIGHRGRGATRGFCDDVQFQLDASVAASYGYSAHISSGPPAVRGKGFNPDTAMSSRRTRVQHAGWPIRESGGCRRHKMSHPQRSIRIPSCFLSWQHMMNHLVAARPNRTSRSGYPAACSAKFRTS